MREADLARQFSFRLPEQLIARVEACAEELRENGLEVSRADVVRLLLRHALDATQCRVDLLVGRSKPKRAAPGP